MSPKRWELSAFLVDEVFVLLGERRSKEREEPPAPQQPPAPMIEEYNHGKEFPTLKSLPGLRFRKRADPRDSSKSDRNRML